MRVHQCRTGPPFAYNAVQRAWIEAQVPIHLDYPHTRRTDAARKLGSAACQQRLLHGLCSQGPGQEPDLSLTAAPLAA